MTSVDDFPELTENGAGANGQGYTVFAVIFAV